MRLSLSLFTLVAAGGFALAAAHADPAPKSQTVEPVSPSVQATAASYNALAQKVFRDPSGANSVYSPFSLGVAMSFVLEGARGTTRSEIARVMEWPETTVEPAKAAQDISVYLEKRTQGSAGVTFKVANLLALPKGVSVLPSYSKSFHDAEGEILVNADDAAVERWVLQHTDNKIQGPFTINTDAPTLVNATYFKGIWASPFDKSKTRDEDFTSITGEKLRVRTMVMEKAGFGLARGKSYRAVSLPYQGDNFVMVIVLPNRDRTVQEAQAEYFANGTNQWLFSEPGHGTFELRLPRFTGKATCHLERPLQNAGIKLAFSNQSDFSGITPPFPGIKIDRVMQKALIEVDEEGAVAAAVTAVFLKPVSSILTRTPPPFIVDRPFLFFIYGGDSNAILFQGHIDDPRGGERPDDMPC